VRVFLADAYRTCRRRAGKTVNHPLAVGELLSDDGQPSAVVVAGVLPNVLEDTDITPAELHERFGPDIARLAEALTQDTAIMKHGERKAALRRQILDVGPEAAIVSLADKAAKLHQRRPPQRPSAGIGPSGPAIRSIGLLQHVASGRCPSLGDVANELRLSRREVRDPVDIAGSRTALDRAGDCLQRLLIA
jgi:hypothetical protein